MSSINEKIIINKMNKPELIGNIIDIFEDFLDDKGIIIPNPEKDEDPELDITAYLLPNFSAKAFSNSKTSCPIENLLDFITLSIASSSLLSHVSSDNL